MKSRTTRTFTPSYFDLQQTSKINGIKTILSTRSIITRVTASLALMVLWAPFGLQNLNAQPSTVLLDDTWADGTRSDTGLPFESAWFANVASSLTNLAPGSMTGTPELSSSRTWLTYFTVSAVNPVTLSIGETLKVTCSFVPINVAAPGGLGLRVGLFNFADGGTRATQDGGFVGNSTGSGTNVTGYMLSQYFGTVFDNEPMRFLARTNLASGSLMQFTSDYFRLPQGGGPAGYINVPAFSSGAEYTLEYAVTRTPFDSVEINATITGNGLNISYTVTDTYFSYYRFDCFAIRCASTTNTADSLTFTRFKVEVVPTNFPPVIEPVPDQDKVAGQTLVITNTASDPDGVLDAVAFTLSADAPAGATITTNGIFTWTPTCSQGSTTNLITIAATDYGEPRASSTMSFSVVVAECIEVSLGQTVLQTGATSSVPVRLLSTTALTNMTFSVLYPADRFTNFTIAVNAPEILSQWTTNLTEPGQLQVGFTLSSSVVLHGPTNVGELGFTALVDQHSALVPLPIINVTGHKTNGEPVGVWFGYPGRAVVVGEEPLLEAILNINRDPALIVYGLPGWNINLEARTSLQDTSPWQNAGQVQIPVTNLLGILQNVMGTNQMVYYRGLRN